MFCSKENPIIIDSEGSPPQQATCQKNMDIHLWVFGIFFNWGKFWKEKRKKIELFDQTIGKSIIL